MGVDAAWRWFVDWWSWGWKGWTALEAIATALAFGAAFVLLYFEGRSHTAAWRDRRRAQAAKVYTWIAERPAAQGGAADLDDESDDSSGGTIYWVLKVRNASDTPIFAVTLDVEDPNFDEKAGDHTGFQVGSSAFTGPDFRTVGPGETRSKDYDVYHSELGRCIDDPTAVAYFRDANEVTWRRDAEGALKEIKWSEHPWQMANAELEGKRPKPRFDRV